MNPIMKEVHNLDLDVSIGNVLYRITNYVEPTDTTNPADIGRINIESLIVVYSSAMLDTDEILVGTIDNDEVSRKYHTESVTVYRDANRALKNTELHTLRDLIETGYSNRKVDAIAIFVKKEKAKHRAQTESVRAELNKADLHIAALTKCAKISSDQETE